jgi:RecA/RadA recombinase
MSETLRRLSEVDVPPEGERLSTGVAGLDVCLAESEQGPPGLPRGASILLSGAPGGGKSTIATYMADAAGECLILYGDEKERSLRKRWERLGLGKKGCDPHVAKITTTEEALDIIRQLSPAVTVVDSVQMLSHEGSRKYDAQAEGVEQIIATCEAAGNSSVFVCHVDKSGTKHAGAQALAHIVDVHLHVSTNAKKNERALEVRKNRLGRAGFQVSLHVTGNLLTVGTPAPITGDGSLVQARSKLEVAKEAAIKAFLLGRSLNGYDFMEFAPDCSGGLWRCALEMAVKQLRIDGLEMVETKVGGRRTFAVHPDFMSAKDEPPANGHDLAAALDGPRPIEMS